MRSRNLRWAALARVFDARVVEAAEAGMLSVADAWREAADAVRANLGQKVGTNG